MNLYRAWSSSALGGIAPLLNEVRPALNDAVGLMDTVEDPSPGERSPARLRLRFHHLRRTYALLLIARGVNVVFVSRQLAGIDHDPRP